MSETSPPNTNRSYFFPSCGPWGVTLDDELRTESRLNASFSQNAWANAQLTGCLPRPCRPLPNWPPPAGEGFIYPTFSDTKEQELLDLGVATGCPATYDLESPYAGGGRFSIQANNAARGVVINPRNPNECPSKTPTLNSSFPSSGPLSADMASRVASKILGLPPPPPSSSFSSVPLLVPSPSPSNPDPYDKPKCELDNSQFSVGEVAPCTWNTLRGITYDFQHWNQLPRNSTSSKLGYVFGRDDRPFYLMILAVVFILVLFILRFLFGRKKTSTPKLTTR